MSLQYWLPLINNVENAGKSIAKITSVTASPTQSQSYLGGGSYSFNGSSSYLLSNTGFMNNSVGDFTYTCWFKPNSAHNGCLFSSRTEVNTTGIALFYYTTQWLFDDGVRWQFTPSTMPSVGAWNHICFVRKKGVGKYYYLNGVLVSSTTDVGTPSAAGPAFSIGGSQSNQTTVSGNWLNGYLNDVRIYDHALSAEDIKVLAGNFNSLSLHYDLATYIEPDGSRWAHIAHHNNPAGGVFASNDTFSTGVYKDANRWYDIESIMEDPPSLEFMVKQKLTSSSSEVKYRWIQKISPLKASWADVQKSNVIRITSSGYTDGTFGGIYILNSSTRMCIANDSNGNWFGAFGSWTAYNGGIPGYPNNTVTSGYMDLYVRIRKSHEGLQVWLPLVNGNLTNYGMSDLKFSNINSSYTASYSIGKLGKCFRNTSNSAGGLVSDTTISLGQHQSMACWFKFDSLQADSNLGGGMVSQHRYPNNSGMGMTIKYVSSTTGYLSVNTGNGSSRTYNTYCATTLLQAGTWYHGAYTYDGANIKLYINGVLEATHANSGMLVPEDYISCFSWSFGSTYGNDVYGSYKLNGYINDIRVYNKTLTDDEIKTLARGLCLRYELNNRGNGIKNLVLNSNQGWNSTGYNIVYGNMSENWVVGDTYTITIKGKPSSGCSFGLWRDNGWAGCGSLTNNPYGDIWTMTFTCPAVASSSTAALTAFSIYDVPSSATHNAHIDWIKIEKSSTSTPYGINTVSIEPDVSGFHNHGIPRNASMNYSTDTKIFPVSTVFNGSSDNIQGSFPSCDKTITFALWVKFTSTSTGMHLLDCRNNSGTGYQPMYITSTTVQIGGSGNSFPNINYNFATNTWYHIVVVYGISNAKVFINGVLVATDTTTAGYNYNTMLPLFLGSRYSAQNWLNGKISDFRIYATALSDADVLALYNGKI